MLRNELNSALKTAMKAKEATAVSTLRLILAALKDRDIAARGKGSSEGISDEDILEMLQKMVRQRRESIEAYTKGSRPDLVEKEEAEIAVIERFLPQQMTPEETAAAVEAVVSELQAGSVKDMGKVMARLKEQFSGRMDFGKASQLVKQRLS